MQANDAAGSFVDVFLAKSGLIVVLKKQSQTEEHSKLRFVQEENRLLERLKQDFEENGIR